ncbi:MAG: hypothetical protein V4641_12945 [Pseudomonadota bacterium]
MSPVLVMVDCQRGLVGRFSGTIRTHAAQFDPATSLIVEDIEAFRDAPQIFEQQESA